VELKKQNDPSENDEAQTHEQLRQISQTMI